jgi:hypothetical protein
MVEDVRNGEVVGECAVDQSESGSAERNKTSNSGSSRRLRQTLRPEAALAMDCDLPQRKGAHHKVVDAQNQTEKDCETTECCHSACYILSLIAEPTGHLDRPRKNAAPLAGKPSFPWILYSLKLRGCGVAGTVITITIIQIYPESAYCRTSDRELKK